MKNVSSEFIQAMDGRRNFTYLVKVAFADGRTLELGDGDLRPSGSSILSGAGQNAFPLGAAAAQRLTLQIVNNDDRFEDYDFVGAVFRVWLKFALSATTESVYLGKFTVIDPESYGSTVTVTAVDDMYKADRDYSTTLVYPVRMGEALRDSCTTCGLTLLTTVPANADYVIRRKPENLTHRQFIGLCAMIAGGNAVADEYGRIRIITYNMSVFEQTAALDGGVFDTAHPYATGDTADGGAFNPWNQPIYDAGDFSHMNDYHVFHRCNNPMLTTDDVMITGIRIAEDDEVYSFGEEGYVLQLENQLCTGNEQEAANRIGRLLVGLRFRPFTVDHICYPLAEFGDLCCVIDRKNRVYRSIVTDVDFSFRGFTVMKCSADSPMRNSGKYPASAEIKAIIKSRGRMSRLISDYDKAVQMLTGLITQSFGVFRTEEVLEDGSVIYYLHNKPFPKDSKTIWKMTADAFAVSTDYGKTWNAGIDSSGNAVLNVLSAIGINADWINTGSLSADLIHGGILRLGGRNNVDGAIYVYDSSGSQIGYWTGNGFYAKSGTFAGNLSGAGGTFSGDLSAAGGTFSGDLAAAGGTFEGTMSAGRIEGVDIFGSSLYSENYYRDYRVHVHEGSIDFETWHPDSKKYESYGGISLSDSYYLTGDYGDEALSPEVPSTIIRGTGLTAFIIDNTRVLSLQADVPTSAGGTSGMPGIVANAELICIDTFMCNGGIYADGGLYVYGEDHKSKVFPTDHYADRILSCYETPTPMFGDIGTGITDNSGFCYVSIDDIFSETISGNVEYAVFLQKEGPGDIWVDSKESAFFVVKGTPNLPFSWEIKAVQRGFDTDRLNDFGMHRDSKVADPDDLVKIYDSELEQHDTELTGVSGVLDRELNQYDAEMEEILDEDFAGISGN